jgi:hypothetical protein
MKYNCSLSEALESVIPWSIPPVWKEAINAAVAALEKA